MHAPKPLIAGAGLAAALIAASACSRPDKDMRHAVSDPAPQAGRLTADSGHPGPFAAAGALNPSPRAPNTSQ